MPPLRQSGESAETQRADPEVNRPTSKKKIRRALVEKFLKLLNDPQTKALLLDWVAKTTLGDPNKEPFGKACNKASDGCTVDNLRSISRSIFRLEFKDSSKDHEEIIDKVVAGVLNEAVGEVSDEESMDGLSVFSSVEKDVLDLHGMVAKLDAKMDILMEYHRTGKWPDN
ncbi:hypothetical protein J3F84DRAFT_17010 [Trichoderma pleuroticola]